MSSYIHLFLNIVCMLVFVQVFSLLCNYELWLTKLVVDEPLLNAAFTVLVKYSLLLAFMSLAIIFALSQM